MTFSATLASRFDPRANNIDLIRLVAAVAVVFGHAWSLTDDPAQRVDPVSTAVGLGYIGTLAVAAFFVLSGFLVTRSVERSTLGAYLAARALRILPALAFVTLLEAFVLGPLFFEGDVGWYLTNIAPKHLWNVSIFGQDPWMAGVFTQNPVPMVNGALWTLPIETLFYLLLPFVMMLARGRRWVVLLMFAACLAGEQAARWVGLGEANPGAVLFNEVRAYQALTMGGFYLAGVAAWLYRDRIAFDGGLFCLALMLLFAVRGGEATQPVLKLCFSYAVLWIGIAGRTGARLKAALGDLSYGTYLFGFPVIGCVIALGHQRLPPAAVFACALPATLVLAALSWHLVERPALWLRRRLASRRVGMTAMAGD